MNPLQSIDFRSDNVAPAAPEVLRALSAVDSDSASPYGEDDATRALPALLSAVFERPAVGWPLPTGTAANAMTLSVMLPTGGIVFCHERAHAYVSEEGATVYANSAISFRGLPGEHGRIDRAQLEKALDELRSPAVLTLTQANEFGCAYDLETLAALGALAHRRGVRVHIDGARLAAACGATGTSPAEVVNSAAADALSLGLTKVGAMDTDVAIFFSGSLPDDWRSTMRRAGFLTSKARYQSMQIHALLKNGLWLQLADHAVSMARRLRAGLETSPGVVSVRPSESNVLLVEFAPAVLPALMSSRFLVKPWHDPRWTRLVTSYMTEQQDIDLLLAWLTQSA
jgi:threonine aldolase